jgi:hypothetical protein
MTPILLLEVNEIPWRLLDRYLGRPEFPHVNKFFEISSHFTTVTVDIGELSPWVTWPTFHRGMNNEKHGIKNLGQDPSTFKGKPIWQEIRERGGSIGVCGSMQSWPPLEPGEDGFYVPDTFAHDERCHPAYLNPLQEFNLSQVRRNARVVSSSLPRAAEVLRVAASSIKSGLKLRTGARIAGQLLGERIDKSLTARRPMFQTILFWDVFRKHFKVHRPPQFSTFFTNHVAGVMHRYWKDVFPEDFLDEASSNGESHEWLMRFALRVLDDVLRDVLDWVQSNPDLVVVFASSMGQDAVHRDYHEGVDLVVEDLPLLVARTGLERFQYRPLLAMAPQVAIEVNDEALRERTRRILESAYCGNGRRLMRVQTIGPSLSITIATPPANDLAADTFHIDGREVTWTSSGLRKQPVEPGTGYHIPEGTLAVLSVQLAGSPPHQDRTTIPADRIKNWLLAVSAEGHAKIPALASLAS